MMSFFVGGVTVVAYVFVVVSYIHFPPQASGETLQVLSVLIGTLGNMAGMVVGYYFGSSVKTPAPAPTVAVAPVVEVHNPAPVAPAPH